MRDLTQHLTTRADDSHAAPVLGLRRGPRFQRLSPACQAQVRFFALLRIKPHAPPLVRAPVNSFEFQPCGRTPQAGHLTALAAARKGSLPPAPSAHRLRRGLPGYLILFAPHAFAPQRQTSPEAAFATGILPDLYAFHRYTGNSTSSTVSSPPVSKAAPRLSRGISLRTCRAACTRFTPSNSEQRSHPPSYRGCWHRVSRCFLWRYRHDRGIARCAFVPPDSGLHPEGLPPTRGVAGSGFRPLPKIPHCCLP